MNSILADGRWVGTHGIGRFTFEVLSRLQNIDVLDIGPKPLSLKNIFWLPKKLNAKQYKVFFNPGFNPILHSSIPYIITIHDLIHLYSTGKFSFFYKLYYELLVKYSIKKAYKIMTVSEYSKKNIVEWANVNPENIIVVGNGISHHFKKDGFKHQPGYSYLLHVGNSKSHKNLLRLIQAFAIAKIDPKVKLILTGEKTIQLSQAIIKNQLQDRIVFANNLSDELLAEYYRGADAFILPSLFEGFGIPIIEAMACGTPTVISNVTSLPEVAGDAALPVDPYDVQSIASGIESIMLNQPLRKNLIEKGFERIQNFSWDRTAQLIQDTLLNA